MAMPAVMAVERLLTMLSVNQTPPQMLGATLDHLPALATVLQPMQEAHSRSPMAQQHRPLLHMMLQALVGMQPCRGH